MPVSARSTPQWVRRHGTWVGTNLAMASATAAGLSTGTHVLAPGTETSVALGKSDASRCACAIGKKPQSSPQASSTGRSNCGIAAAASYLATAARHGIGWLDALTRAAEGSPWSPETG